jgi:hypothetical protein
MERTGGNIMTTPHQWAAEIHAMADGKEVEWFNCHKNKWVAPINARQFNPLTNPCYNWRIKPEKQVLRYRVAKMNDGGFYSATADNEKDARDLKKSEYFVEWADDWQEVEVE